jgi:ubiquinone biosynthesis protein UbiJ
MERCEEIINTWGAGIIANPSNYQDVSGVLKLTVTGVGDWRFKFGASATFTKGDGKADCSVVVTPSVLAKLNDPQENPQELFLNGDILISGDFNLALYMNQFFGGGR